MVKIRGQHDKPLQTDLEELARETNQKADSKEVYTKKEVDKIIEELRKKIENLESAGG